MSLAASVAGAASLQVAPTAIAIAARQNADGLWLSNTGGDPLYAQVRVYRWTQVDGEDRLELTRDIIVSPPMTHLPPGEKQLVRVIRLGPPPVDIEASYRVIVDELPVPDSTAQTGLDGDNSKRAGLQFVLRYSLPVFLLPATARAAETAAQPTLRTQLTQDDGKSQLEISNSGTGHAQISDLIFVDNNGRRHMVRDGLAGYVLPGQRKRWGLPASLSTFSAPVGVFKARINGEFTERDLLQPSIDVTRPAGAR